MAQLSKVVSSILRDMVLAQHEANMYALRLAEPYRKSGKSGNLPFPCVALGEMDLEIKYAVIDASAPFEQLEIDYQKLDKIISKLSLELSDVIIATMVSTVISSMPESKEGNDDSLIRKLDEEGELRQKFAAFLSHKLLLEFKRDPQSLVDVSGVLKADAISEIAVKIGRYEVIHHQDLNSYFNLNSEEDIRQKTVGNLNATINGILPHLIKDINVIKKEMYESINIAISSEELAKYAKESIHSFRFKIAPKDIRINDDDEFNNKQ